MNPFNVAASARSGVQNLLSPQAQEIQTDFMTVRGNILEFKARQRKTRKEKITFYQISNMSAVEVVPLHRDFPWWALFGVVVGLFLPIAALILSVVILVFCGYALISYLARSSDHGLLLLLNAGPAASVMITSPNREFLIKVARVLSDLMNERIAGETTFNIHNQEITMRDVTGALVNTGAIHGGAIHSVKTGTDN